VKPGRVRMAIAYRCCDRFVERFPRLFVFMHLSTVRGKRGAGLESSVEDIRSAHQLGGVSPDGTVKDWRNVWAANQVQNPTRKVERASVRTRQRKSYNSNDTARMQTPPPNGGFATDQTSGRSSSQVTVTSSDSGISAAR
jgi:hypothetical protein